MSTVRGTWFEPEFLYLVEQLNEFAREFDVEVNDANADANKVQNIPQMSIKMRQLCKKIKIKNLRRCDVTVPSVHIIPTSDH